MNRLLIIPVRQGVISTPALLEKSIKRNSLRHLVCFAAGFIGLFVMFMGGLIVLGTGADITSPYLCYAFVSRHC